MFHVLQCMNVFMETCWHIIVEADVTTWREEQHIDEKVDHQFSKAAQLISNAFAGTHSKAEACLLLKTYKRADGCNNDADCGQKSMPSFDEVYASQLLLLHDRSDMTLEDQVKASVYPWMQWNVEGSRESLDIWGAPTYLPSIKIFQEFIVSCLRSQHRATLCLIIRTACRIRGSWR